MNTIRAVLGKSRFVSEPHLLFTIDDVPLDKVLSDAHPEMDLLGLIPTTLDWLHDRGEQSVVWSRFLDRSANRAVIPILCCPDDLDFSCSLVVVEAKFEADSVHWLRFGIDKTSADRPPNAVGSSVDWLPNAAPFEFERRSYMRMVEAFEQGRDEGDGTG